MTVFDMWRLIDDGPCDGAFNMALDEAVAESVLRKEQPTTLRFYGWSGPTVTLGAFQRHSDIDTSFCSENSIAIVRRPTGGRAILHGDELTYSFSSLDEGFFKGNLFSAYRALAEAFLMGFQRLGLPCAMKQDREKGHVLTRSPLCFQSTSLGEITCNGMKIIGSAQRRWPDGFMQQGSIPFSVDASLLRGVFGIEDGRDSLSGFTGVRRHDAALTLRKLKAALVEAFETVFGIRLEAGQPSPREKARAEELVQEKYRAPGLERQGRRRALRP